MCRYQTFFDPYLDQRPLTLKRKKVLNRWLLIKAPSLRGPSNLFYCLTLIKHRGKKALCSRVVLAHLFSWCQMKNNKLPKNLTESLEHTHLRIKWGENTKHVRAKKIFYLYIFFLLSISNVLTKLSICNYCYVYATMS